jgi:hypothetical protein
MANRFGKEPDEVFEGRQVVVYAPPFTGKTTTLDDPELKVLLGDMDHNTSPLDDAKNVTIYPIDSFEDYLEFKASVIRGYFLIDKVKYPCTDFDVIALDSFTRFEELIKSWVVRAFAPARAREIKGKFGAQTDWDDLQRTEVEEVREWQALTRTMGFCVIWLGHDMTMENSITKKAERIQLALQGKFASPKIMSAVDAIFYMHKEVDKDKNIMRGMYTQQEGIIQAEARVTLGKRAKLPTYIPVVVWSKILPYLGWKKRV